ncbi:hypothetical protein J7T55_008709 [Diaporthe amygdali]|uniref:uncharacterized protein n=1 Tax=Phomopsis amygdali TaxID=1214568 RepID=UPI0022FE29DC|nr:uncharacterized protein J7T55_008709 [Diaporthe amygdali]KAJ0121545.1 hypothetical protein J7T55_008709 [Diaporthe amygdali]
MSPPQSDDAGRPESRSFARGIASSVFPISRFREIYEDRLGREPRHGRHQTCDVAWSTPRSPNTALSQNKVDHLGQKSSQKLEPTE